MRKFAFAAAALAAALSTLPAAAADVAAGDLRIASAWSRATPPSAPTGAGFLEIKNVGDADDRLLAVDCACAELSQVHEMKMEGGVMQMRELADGLPIPAGATVELAPGGNHLMFIHLKAPFKEGEAFTATLTFERAGKVEVPFDVTGLRGKGMGHGKKH